MGKEVLDAFAEALVQSGLSSEEARQELHLMREGAAESSFSRRSWFVLLLIPPPPIQRI